MDGKMDGWIDRGMGGWMNGWMDWQKWKRKKEESKVMDERMS